MKTGREENDMKNYRNIEARLYLMPKYVEEWYYHLRASDLSSETCKDYINKVYQFLKFINNDLTIVTEVFPEDITVSSIEKYLISKSDKSNSYQSNIWTCLNSFFDFLYKRKYIPENYIQTQGIKQNHKKDIITRPYLAKEHFKKIIKDLSKNPSHNGIKIRDKAILLVFMTTGMRKMALDNINLSDIDFENGVLTVIDKCEKIHTYILTKQTMDAIKEWLEIRDLYLGCESDTDALFVSNQGNRIGGSTLYEIVKKRTEEALGKGYSPHKLRSGFITTMLEETGDLYLTSDAVGHSSIKITQRYDSSVGRGKKRAAEIMGNL